ncbi:MAG: hypothetical protein Q9N34_01320 [Aquificota bacterium]|nr:hypothetical protein [Aquificota bacterium]
MASLSFKKALSSDSFRLSSAGFIKATGISPVVGDLLTHYSAELQPSRGS